MYRTEERERERGRRATFGFTGRAGRWSMSCERIFSFFCSFSFAIVLTRWQADDALFLQCTTLIVARDGEKWRSTSWNALHIPRGSVSQGLLHFIYQFFFFFVSSPLATNRHWRASLVGSPTSLSSEPPRRVMHARRLVVWKLPISMWREKEFRRQKTYPRDAGRTPEATRPSLRLLLRRATRRKREWRVQREKPRNNLFTEIPRPENNRNI